MRLRPLLVVISSVLLGVVLVAILVHVGRIDLRASVRQLLGVSIGSFSKLVLLNVGLIFISTEKWRRVDAALRNASDTVPSIVRAFSMTSFGMAAGLVLPVQMGMTMSRTLGTHFYGRPLQRGTVGTLFEQSFDLVTVLVFTGASVAIWLWHGQMAMWASLAGAGLLLAIVVVGPVARSGRRLAKFAAHKLKPSSRISLGLIKLAELEESGVLNVRLGRELLLLSVVRFFLVVLMAKQTAAAIGSPIPIWQMAAMVPFSVVAMALALTPGAIGVNEVTSVTALTILGSPMSVAAQWAVANRVLATISCLFVAVFAATALAIERPTSQEE